MNQMKLIDNFNRIHDYVRISLIDKCNLNCIYCNPVSSNKHYYHNSELLAADEIIRLSNIFVKNLGVKKIRFTGGEPLIRKDILNILKNISVLKKDFLLTLGITTNGTELTEKLDSLKEYGIDNLNISLDTLKPRRFVAITGKNLFEQTLQSIHRAEILHFNKVKVNAVIMKNVNDDELIDFVKYFKDANIELRFIEYMPFRSNAWQKDGFVSAEEMEDKIKTAFQLSKSNDGNKIANNYSVAGHSLKVGFISSISNHFCDSCNRLRITATGKIKLCLFSSEKNEKGLKELLGSKNIPDEIIAQQITGSLQYKKEKHPEIEELLKLDNNNMLSIGG